jgi:hypothetical protein
MGAQAEVTRKALRKITAAIEGLGHKPVVIGALAHLAWGSKGEARDVELLISSGEAHRESILSAARGEGLQQTPHAPKAPPNPSTLRLRYDDSKLGGAANVDLLESSTPVHKLVMGRAGRGIVLEMDSWLATCEDLILILAGSSLAADRQTIIELLRGNAGRIDAPYLKREAEARGVFGQLKSAWQEAKQQG